MEFELTRSQVEAWRNLPKRQRACIEAMLAGHYSDKAIARVVGLSAATVAEHLKAARARLGVTSRIALVLTAQLLELRDRLLADGAEGRRTIIPTKN